MTTAKAPFNPWPLSIIGFFAVLITIVVSFLIYSLGLNRDLVTPDYYEHDIRFQEQIDRVVRTRALSGEPEVKYVSDEHALAVSLPPVPGAAETVGSIRLYRPSDASLDQTHALALNADGRQSIPVDQLAPGNWRVLIDWRAGDREYFTEHTVILGAAN